MRTILASQWRLQDTNLRGRIVVREMDKPITDINRFMTHMELRKIVAHKNVDVPVTHPDRFTIEYGPATHSMGVYDLRLDEAYTSYIRRCAQEGMRTT